MSELPTISIITVCWNSAATIRRTFESVYQQDYPNLDYVVVDGASTDATLDIIKEYEAKFLARDQQFRWISEPDNGIYDAMNKGIDMTRGEVIGILNSDDFYEPNSLETIADASMKHPEIGIFYGFLRLLLDNKEIQIFRYTLENYLIDLSTGIFTCAQHPTCFVRKCVYDEIGVFDQQFPIAADYDFLVRAMKSGIEFAPLDAILSNFSSGGASGRMSDYERLKQRYGVWHKNGLISDEEYHRKQNGLHYQKYKELKAGVVKWLLRM